MIFCPDKYKRTDLIDYNKEFFNLKGTLDDKEAKITLAKFLRQNIGLSTFLLSGIRLEPYQEITIKGFLNRNFSMCVWGRGCAKTTVAAMFAFLQCVFEPNTNVLVVGPTFRTSRFIFEKIEQIVDSPSGQLLAQCFGAKVRRNDAFEWKINGGSIKAIPLSNERIRGYRANVLILDEFLLLPEEIVKTVLMPFLVAPQDAGERIKIRRIEDALIRQGKMKEEDRKNFTSNVKMICLSSASYTFEYLYKLYSDWSNKILETEKDEQLKNADEVSKVLSTAKYFVSQLGFEAIPKHLIDINIINEARGDVSDAIFQREYEAQFTDGSASYFSYQKMLAVTIPLGQFPCIKTQGDNNKKYIMAIDPSFSNSPSADFFAMSIFELDDDSQIGTLVHSYAKAGLDLKDHINYFYYMLTHFNIVMIIIDNADGNFIDAANESKLFQDAKLELRFFDFDTDKEGNDYIDQIKLAKKNYNLEGKVICFKQFFTQSFIRRANELLQTNIDRQKIFFGSNINGNDVAFDRASSLRSRKDVEVLVNDSLFNLIDNLDSNVYGTKKEASLIEVKTSATGVQSFDLPLKLKRSANPNRPRRDRYTALLLGNWGIKSYYDITGELNTTQNLETFTPFFI